MNREPIPYYALCRNTLRIAQWQARAVEIPGLEFHFWTGFQSMFEFIGKSIRHCKASCLVIAHDDVIIGRDFAQRVRSLVADLDTSFTNWGVVGNAGVEQDGRTYHVYVKDPWCRPQRAHSPDVVVCIDGNLMLINRRALLAAECEYPDLGGFHGYDAVLSFECLRKGLLVLTDGRLHAVHLSGGNRGIYERFVREEKFQIYFQERFSDKVIPTMLGAQPITPLLRRGEPVGATHRPTLRSLQETALHRGRVAQERRIGIVLCEPSAPADVGRLTHVISENSPLLGIEIISVSVDGDPASTPPDGSSLSVPAGSDLNAIVQEAFLRLPHDYLWFITGDATPLFDAVPDVTRALVSAPDSLLVGSHCIRETGQQSMGEVGGSAFLRAMFNAERFPLSALVIPTAPLRELTGGGFLGTRAGDGTLIGALALTTSRIRLRVVPARIVAFDRTSGGGKLQPDAFGSDSDWDYIERQALLDGIIARGNPTIWALAEETTRAVPPPRAVRWAQDFGQVLHALRQALTNPRRYFTRGLLLTIRYLVRGDIQGLVREARLFRPR
jgi:hypothetical protein